MRVLILNTCSTLNRGDSAIVLGEIRLLQHCWPGVRIALTSKTPAVDEAFYGPLGVEVLPPLTPALSSYAGLTAKLAGGARSCVDGRGKKRLLERVARSDVVLSCGGGCFYSYRPFFPGTTFWQNVVHVRLAALMRKPLVLLPQSFGPLKSAAARGAVRGLLNARPVVRVFAREAHSLQLLRQLVAPEWQRRIALCPDMAFYLSAGTEPLVAPARPTHSAQPTLAMNLREWAFPEYSSAAERHAGRERYLNALTCAGAWFIERHRGRVIVMPQALGPDPSEDDRAICQAFVERVRARANEPALVQFVNPGTASLSDYLRLLSQVTLVVGTRLHACILAMLAGAPAISVGYQAKSQGTLAMLGLQDLNLDIAEVTTERLVSAMERVLADREALVVQIAQQVEAAAARIDRDVGSLLRSLDGGSARPAGDDVRVVGQGRT
jgi:colanic acid/amylovoran biosynthesis protein